jgi:CsoR family transcriptional regulator, copper-sensing transcriptional repressor
VAAIAAGMEPEDRLIVWLAGFPGRPGRRGTALHVGRIDFPKPHDTLQGYSAFMGRGYSDNKGAVQRRLRRIEGQVRGIQRMVEEDRYCINILEQISAATRALQSVALELLDDHLTHCVAEAVQAGGAEATARLNEASTAIGRLVRS